MERRQKLYRMCDLEWTGRQSGLVSGKVRKELLELEGDAGGRKVFRRYRKQYFTR
ncbi:MAG: hypothetical protein ACLU92_02340 [Coprococcus comes]